MKTPKLALKPFMDAVVAQMIGAMAETYIIRNCDDHAVEMLGHFCREQHKRYSAFKREVATVVGASRLLKNLNLQKNTKGSA